MIHRLVVLDENHGGADVVLAAAYSDDGRWARLAFPSSWRWFDIEAAAAAVWADFPPQWAEPEPLPPL